MTMFYCHGVVPSQSLLEDVDSPLLLIAQYAIALHVSQYLQLTKSWYAHCSLPKHNCFHLVFTDDLGDQVLSLVLDATP